MRQFVFQGAESGSELLKMIVDDSEAPEDERWDFEGLSEEDNLCIGAQEKTQKPFQPQRRFLVWQLSQYHSPVGASDSPTHP